MMRPGMESPQSPRRILVVDDNLDSAQSFALLLGAMGHQADFVTDPRSAVDTARRLQTEIVFLDIAMPGLDGYQVARMLRAVFGRELRIVAVTAYGDADHRRQSRESGFDAHVLKPADLAIVQSILATVF
jgi:CheY-like chemotaxis protein